MFRRQLSWSLLILVCVGGTTRCSPANGQDLSGDESVAVKTLDLEPRDARRDRVVPVRVYFRERDQNQDYQDSPWPVVLFSHGLGGSRKNNGYLGNHWAADGLVCVFMQHAGSDESVIQSAAPGQRMDALRGAANANSSVERYQDVSFIIDTLERWNAEIGHPLHGKLDLQHIGMSGHSFGSVTTLGVAGVKFPWRRSFAEPRIDAFLALSPSPGKAFSPERALGGIQKPVLCMTGTEDGSPLDPAVTPESRQKVFQALPKGDKYQLVFEGGHHYTFGEVEGRNRRDRDPNHHPAIQRLSLQFWRAYLKEDASAKAWLQSTAPKAEGVLQSLDRWEWK